HAGRRGLHPRQQWPPQRPPGPGRKGYGSGRARTTGKGGMTLDLTPDMLAGAYDYLRLTNPFLGWKLPKSGRVKFIVMKTPHYHADIIYDDAKPEKFPIIRVSRGKVGHTLTLMATMAHEMIHLYQSRIGDSGNHNEFFQRAAR